jgi:hypothetical protein
VSGSISDSNLTVKVSVHGRTISSTPTISYPPNGTAPYPAIIAFGGLTIPAPSGVAIITYNNDEIGAQINQSSRGQGKFFLLYPDKVANGAMTAWAYGLSRIIDALDMLPDAKINTRKIAVTGCSRNGKGALVAGALDGRIALTIPRKVVPVGLHAGVSVTMRITTVRPRPRRKSCKRMFGSLLSLMSSPTPL